MSDAPEWLTLLAAGALEEASLVGTESLRLTSGRVVACDPLVFLTGADPFAREVEPGPVDVTTGEIDGETAFAMLRFGKGKVTTWKVARCPGEEDVEGWPGYGVDSGIGCFVDYDVVKKYAAEEETLSAAVALKLAEEGVDLSDVLAYHEALERYRAELAPDDPLATLERMLAGKPLIRVQVAGGDLVAFRTGVGDGVYASFWGLDATGAVVSLVSDFAFFGDDDEDEEDGEDDELDALEKELSQEMSLEEELGDLSGMGGLDALAAALGMKSEPEPETRQGPSPLFLQSRDLLKSWVRTEKLELEEGINLDAFAEAFLEKLVSLSGQRYVGSHIADWLLERPEVADIFATDDELEADLTR